MMSFAVAGLALAGLAVTAPAMAQGAIHEHSALEEGLTKLCAPFMAGRHPMVSYPAMSLSPTERQAARIAAMGLRVPELSDELASAGWAYSRSGPANTHVFRKEDYWGSVRVSMVGTLCGVTLTRSRQSMSPDKQLFAAVENWVGKAYPGAQEIPVPQNGAEAASIQKRWDVSDGTKVEMQISAQGERRPLHVQVSYYSVPR